jgi:hypothetical protein
MTKQINLTGGSGQSPVTQAKKNAPQKTRDMLAVLSGPVETLDAELEKISAADLKALVKALALDVRALAERVGKLEA